MASQSLYRKWRSQTFSDLIGQEATVRTLRHAVRDGRVAHAYLFRGPRGTGKTSVARLLAKAVNCANPHDGEPCDECVSCREIAEGRSPDVIEIDAASNNGVDNIRDLREHVNVLSSGGRYRVFIIDEAHMLSTQAFNALLKTLEEPPPHIIFVLATTEAHKVLPTIVSRCQPFDFRRISHADIVARLRHVADGEGLTLEPGAADLLARAARGGLRDALSLLDQAMAFCGTVIDLGGVRAMLGLADPGAVRALAEHVAEGHAAEGLHLVHELVEAGADLRQLNSQVAEYWRALMLARAGADVSRLMDRGEDEAREIAELARRFALEELTACARVFAANETPARGMPVPQLGLELAFLECLAIRRRGGVAALDVTTTAGPARDGQGGTDGRRQVAAPARPPVTPAPPVTSPAPAAMPRPEALPVEGEIEELDLDMFEPGASRGRGSGPSRAAAGVGTGTAPGGRAEREMAPGPRPTGQMGAPRPTAAVPGTTSGETGGGDIGNVSDPNGANVSGRQSAGDGAPGGAPGGAALGGAAPGGAPMDGEAPAANDWLRRAQHDWLLIRKICKQKSGKIYGLLADARPVNLRAGDPPMLVLAADHDFHMRSLREPANAAVVEWALAQVFEAPCRVRVVLAGSAEATAADAGSQSGAGHMSAAAGGAIQSPATGPATGPVMGAPRASANWGNAADGASAARRANADASGSVHDARAESVAGTAPEADYSGGRRAPGGPGASALDHVSGAVAANGSAATSAVTAGHSATAGDERGDQVRGAGGRDAPASGAGAPGRAVDPALEAAARADPVVMEVLRTYPNAFVEVRPLDPEETE